MACVPSRGANRGGRRWVSCDCCGYPGGKSSGLKVRGVVWRRSAVDCSAASLASSTRLRPSTSPSASPRIPTPDFPVVFAFLVGPVPSTRAAGAPNRSSGLLSSPATVCGGNRSRQAPSSGRWLASCGGLTPTEPRPRSADRDDAPCHRSHRARRTSRMAAAPYVRGKHTARRPPRYVHAVDAGNEHRGRWRRLAFGGDRVQRPGLVGRGLVRDVRPCEVRREHARHEQGLRKLPSCVLR